MGRDERYAALVELGCIVCRNWLEVFSPAEIHHIRARGSMGRKAKDTETIPLCPMHHRTGPYGVAYHAGRVAFEDSFAAEERLLELTNTAIKELDHG